MTTADSTTSSPSVLPKPPFWWKSLTSIYQIYPASFLQTSPTPHLSSTTSTANPDDSIPPPPTKGLGSLPGITSSLPYLSSLGIQAIWLSPVYPSPLADMGYDISNYTSIDPVFGTLSDMDTLIRQAHALNIRVLMDLVINHTSDQHHWFQESKKSKHGKYADYYMWHDPKITKDQDGNEVRSPPNNWGSFFHGSAWTYVPERNQYYLHLFVPGQPDLNWESASTRKAIYDDAIRFWLDRGVDGFRVDTCGIYSKDPTLADGEVDKDSRFGEFGDPEKGVANGPRIHEFWQEIRKDVLDGYGDVLMVGELGSAGREQTLKYVERKRGELSMVFDFQIASVGTKPFGGFELASWSLKDLKDGVARNQAFMEGDSWASVFAENHDLPRSVSRFGSGSVTRKEEQKGGYWERSSKVLCLLLASLSGTLYIYEGQEIGMTNFPETWKVDDLMDVLSFGYFRDLERKHPGDKELLKQKWKAVVAMSRDNARTPMQWSSEKNAGFSQEKPWMRINDNFKEINVEEQKGREDSVWSFWKKMLSVRKENMELLAHGSYHVHDLENEKTFMFEKRGKDGKTAVVVSNWTEEDVDFKLPETEGKKWELVLSNIANTSEKQKLEPWEGRLYLAS